MNMLAWVRPEVSTSAAIYGMYGLVPLVDGGVNDDFTPKSDSQFDPAAFYEAVKPSTPVATRKWGVLVSALCNILLCRWMKFYRFLLVKQKLKGTKSLGKL